MRALNSSLFLISLVTYIHAVNNEWLVVGFITAFGVGGFFVASQGD